MLQIMPYKVGAGAQFFQGFAVDAGNARCSPSSAHGPASRLRGCCLIPPQALTTWSGPTPRAVRTLRRRRARARVCVCDPRPPRGRDRKHHVPLALLAAAAVPRSRKAHRGGAGRLSAPPHRMTTMRVSGACRVCARAGLGRGRLDVLLLLDQPGHAHARECVRSRTRPPARRRDDRRPCLTARRPAADSRRVPHGQHAAEERGTAAGGFRGVSGAVSLCSSYCTQCSEMCGAGGHCRPSLSRVK
jgi:hypothetical protein